MSSPAAAPTDTPWPSWYPAWAAALARTAPEDTVVSRVFSGRAGRRALAPGAYRLTAVATADGLASPARTAGFTILRG